MQVQFYHKRRTGRFIDIIVFGIVVEWYPCTCPDAPFLGGGDSDATMRCFWKQPYSYRGFC